MSHRRRRCSLDHIGEVSSGLDGVQVHEHVEPFDEPVSQPAGNVTGVFAPVADEDVRGPAHPTSSGPGLGARSFTPVRCRNYTGTPPRLARNPQRRTLLSSDKSSLEDSFGSHKIGGELS